MSRRLAYFATPEEIDGALERVRVSVAFGAWKLAEGSGFEVGPLTPAPATVRPGEVSFLGEPPGGVKAASVRQAIVDWGFITWVRPVQDDPGRCLWLGEFMTTTEVSARGNPLFVAITRQVTRLLVDRSIVHRLDGRSGSGPGPRYSQGARDLFEAGYTWRAPGVAMMAYVPPPVVPHAERGRPPR